MCVCACRQLLDLSRQVAAGKADAASLRRQLSLTQESMEKMNLEASLLRKDRGKQFVSRVHHDARGSCCGNCA